MKSPADRAAAAPEDSSIAQAVSRGVCRMLAALGQAPLVEFTLGSGRRVDVIALAEDGSFTVIEIKSSLADFRADRKWPEYLDYCNRFFFAVPEGFPTEVLPEEQGLIVADSYGAEILRESGARTLAPARRRALWLRFARTAAGRLLALSDPPSLP